MKTTQRLRSLLASRRASLLAPMLVLTVSACVKESAAKRAPQPLPVKVGKAKRQDVMRKLELIAQLKPFEQVVIYPRASGYLRTVEVDRGHRVKKGQLLATIDVPDLKVKILRWKAQQAADRAQWVNAHATHRVKKVIHDKLKKLWKVAPGATPRLQVDQAAGAVSIAHARLGAAWAQQAIAKAQLAHLYALIRFASVRAPFAGTITRRDAHPGTLVTAGSTKQPLFRLVRADPLRGVVDIPAPDAPFVHVKQRLSLRIDALPGKPRELRIARVAGALDPRTRTLRVEFDLPNPGGKLLPGMMGRVTIDIEKRVRSLVVPAGWLLVQKRRRSVFIVRHGKIKRVVVRTGVENGRVVEILGGLTGSELIVTHPSTSLADGIPVAVKR